MEHAKRTLPSWWGLVLGSLTALASSGCMGGLRVETVATSAQKPSNVAIYVSVSKGPAKDPALGLSERSFHVFEDGQELSPEQSQQVLLPRDMAAVHRALLLVDMSGPVTVGDTRQTIAMAVARFVTKAHVAEPVTVYAFDGAAAPRFIADYPEGTDEITDVPALSSYTPSDPSSNLDGAVIEALAQLDARLMTAQRPLRIGSLVVFARGPDLAGRVTEGKMREALSETTHLVFAIGIKDTPGFKASRIGEEGAFEAESATSLLSAFDQAGDRVAAAVGRYYLLSYCSPSRAGTRRLRVKVVTTDAENKEVSGTTSGEIDTSGFGSGCDPTAKPRFVVPAPTKEDHTGKDDARDAPGKPGKVNAGHATTKAPAPSGDTDDGDTVVPPPSKPGYAQ